MYVHAHTYNIHYHVNIKMHKLHVRVEGCQEGGHAEEGGNGEMKGGRKKEKERRQ
jgi:hypothetical protein